jgi:hypothetical protein
MVGTTKGTTSVITYTRSNTYTPLLAHRFACQHSVSGPVCAIIRGFKARLRVPCRYRDFEESRCYSVRVEFDVTWSQPLFVHQAITHQLQDPEISRLTSEAPILLFFRNSDPSLTLALPIVQLFPSRSAGERETLLCSRLC